MTTEISSSSSTCHQEVDKVRTHDEAAVGNDETATKNPGDNQKQSSDGSVNTKQEIKAGSVNDAKSPEGDLNDSGSKNDSSNQSTAFTISFDDDANSNSNPSGKKLFGIRDSIRKFAPPKPNTIEKPRPSKADSACQDNSYISIESAPGGYPKNSPTFRRDQNNASHRSSGRRSESSRQSNISESAAFLIDKMLNNEKQGESLSSIYSDSDNKARRIHRGQTITLSSGDRSRLKNQTSDENQLFGEEILDDDIDYCEDRSDNGTYIVGADPESDAARKRIDELFGVVKAAEASLVASAAASAAAAKQKSKAPLATRPSRAPDKKPTQQISRERQEHINRLAMGRNLSRSSSSSRQELASVGGHRSRSSNKQPQQRNSSCDRNNYSKLPTAKRHHRRATSQSSRQSSNHDPSEPDDTRSSRSSLHTQDVSDILAQQEIQNSNLTNPSMKFNRAFALRRARLGLGEPTRIAVSQNSQLGSDQDGPVSLLSSPKKVPVGNVAGGGMYPRYNQVPTSSQSLSRTDGGRFSLRMRNHVASRLNAGLKSNRQHHGTALMENYLGKVQQSSCNKLPAASSTAGAVSTTRAPSSIAVPYASGDELDSSPLSPSRGRPVINRPAGQLNVAPGTKMQNLLQRRDVAPEWEMIDSDNRLSYSLCLDQSDSNALYGYGERCQRACQSATRRETSSAMAGQQQPPLGALDCLVISAISSLSMKIRGSVCDLMVEHAKRLPNDNETRLIVEEILPQLSADSARPRSPTSIEEIDQSVYFDLAQTLKNLKKLEQMVDVMKMISNYMSTGAHNSQDSSNSNSNSNSNRNSNSNTTSKSSSASLNGGIQGAPITGAGASAEPSTVTVGRTTGPDSNTNSEATSLSPV